jgi:dTDP-glucose 4,6-dehydratase
LWSRLAGASILLTGATGWFGVWLLDVLCMADDAFALGLRIAAVSRDPARFRARFPALVDDRRVTWIESDVRHLKLEADRFDTIIHGATDTVVSRSPEAQLQMYETTIDGTRRVIEAAGAGCKGLLLVSSGAIYGPARPGFIKFLESAPAGPDPSLPRNAYAEGKRAAEQFGAIAASRGVPIRIARCFAFVGAHMPFDKHFAIGNFIADAVDGRPIRVRSDGRPQRSYLYMTDLVRALLEILTQGDIGVAYNVGSEEAVTIEELAHCVDRVVGGRGVQLDGVPSSPADRYIPDTSRLRETLGFTPEVSLETAIGRTAAWYRAQREQQIIRSET